MSMGNKTFDGVVAAVRTETDRCHCAAIHAACFAEPWDANALAQLLAMPGAIGLSAHDTAGPAGFILVRIAGDDCEIITLAVLEKARGRGTAGMLVNEAALRAVALGATRQILEVGAKNHRALKLYTRLGFERCGKRPGYYADGDALILARPIDGSS